MKNLVLTFCFLLSGLATDLIAQEFIFDVTVATPQAVTADAKVFKDLETKLENFLNTEKWTDEEYEEHEKIKGTIQLTIKDELNSSNFSAELAIQASRPVYGTNYETAILSHLDKDVTFSFTQYQPIDYSEGIFTENLSAILAFYCYYILGADNDSFSPLGGDVYFQKALDIVNLAPATGVTGWASAQSTKNRYWVIESTLSPRAVELRKALYDYHLKSLDIMSSDITLGRANMMAALETIEKVNKSYPNALVLRMFINTKSSEIIEIYKQGLREEKAKIYNLMVKIDPANAIKYRAIGT